MTAVDLAEGMAERNVPKLIKRHEKARWLSINSSQRCFFFCRVSIVKQQVNKLITAPKLSSTSTCWYARTLTLAGYRPPASLHVDTNAFYRRGSRAESSLRAGGLASLKQKPRLKRVTFVCVPVALGNISVFLFHLHISALLSRSPVTPRGWGGWGV